MLGDLLQGGVQGRHRYIYVCIKIIIICNVWRCGRIKLMYLNTTSPRPTINSIFAVALPTEPANILMLN
jgi:hypothetical protein